MENLLKGQPGAQENTAAPRCSSSATSVAGWLKPMPNRLEISSLWQRHYCDFLGSVKK